MSEEGQGLGIRVNDDGMVCMDLLSLGFGMEMTAAHALAIAESLVEAAEAASKVVVEH